MERTYRIHVASEMSGVSEGLIRAWERRHGVLKPRRTSSGYRAYTAQDIELLRRIKKLTEEGVSIAEAVRLLPQLKRDLKAEDELGERPGVKIPRESQCAQWRATILEASLRGDQGAIDAVLDEAAASMPPVTFFEEVASPLLVEVGDRWHAGSLTVAEEHLVTQAVRNRLLLLLAQAPKRARHHVVCACFPEEQHEVGLLGAALRFRHAGWRVTWLGQRTPAIHLARVVLATRPDLVAVSAVHDPGAQAFTDELSDLVAQLPPGVRVVVGGRAALLHAAAAEALGCVLARTDDEWSTLLR